MTPLEKAQETHVRMMEGIARGNRLGDADMARGFRELAAKARLEVERLAAQNGPNCDVEPNQETSDHTPCGQPAKYYHWATLADRQPVYICEEHYNNWIGAQTKALTRPIGSPAPYLGKEYPYEEVVA